MNKTGTAMLALVLLGAYLWNNNGPSAENQTAPRNQTSATHETNKPSGASVIADAFTRRLENAPVEAEGRVLRVLPDDNRGSRHQRFLLDTGFNHTVLVAHNIDLAPRIENLQRGDSVRFKGDYEWNAKGGVVHWTHRDPSGRHADGWLEHKGQRYQ